MPKEKEVIGWCFVCWLISQLSKLTDKEVIIKTKDD